MKLSEAILLGSTLGKQLFDEAVDDEGNTCALGAAMLAIGEIHEAALDYWPWLKDPRVWCHCPGRVFGFRRLLGQPTRPGARKNAQPTPGCSRALGACAWSWC
jgi:hypothetical protein